MAVPKIDSYQFGQLFIDGRRYSNDVIIYPDRVDGPWWREKGHSLALVIGQGNYGRMEVPLETRRRLQAAGMK